MAEKLKDLFFQDIFINDLAEKIYFTYTDFDKEKFINHVRDERWQSRELKEKMRHISASLGNFLPEDYEKSLDILIKISHHFSGFDAMVFPDFVECYGLNHWKSSLSALKHFTHFSSSEFAIRPFLLKNQAAVIEFLIECSLDENEHVRRFASEGCRPRLPWAVAIPALKKDPKPILPILENLKNDPSLYVRKSVANNLNDISKDHPELALSIAEKWYNKTKNTDWIVKQACRTLLKKGNPKAMALFGFNNSDKISINNFIVNKDKIHIGENVLLKFQIKVKSKKPTKIRLEYIVDYIKTAFSDLKSLGS